MHISYFSYIHSKFAATDVPERSFMEPSSKSTSMCINTIVIALSGLGGLVIQPAVLAISLCWLG